MDRRHFIKYMNSIEAKIGQLFFIGIPGPEMDATTESLIKDIQPGGVCLFARNIREALQTRALNDELRGRSQIRPLISVDQEGGTVDRLKRVFSPSPAASKLRSAADAAKLGRITAEALSLLGFDMDFAPVLDVIDESRERIDNGLYSRSFGGTPEIVIERAQAFLAALKHGGILTSAKHFPGLGAAEVDSHAALPTIGISREELFDIDLKPYLSLLPSGLIDSVMVAHTAFPNTDLQETDVNGKLLPSSLSGSIVDTLLRGQLGFNGLVITDDLEMGAIVNEYGIGEAVVMAILAGIDMLAICAGIDSIYAAFEAMNRAVAERRIDIDRLDRSIERIAAVKQKTLDLPSFSPDRFAELSEEMKVFSGELN